MQAYKFCNVLCYASYMGVNELRGALLSKDKPIRAFVFVCQSGEQIK